MTSPTTAVRGRPGEVVYIHVFIFTPPGDHYTRHEYPETQRSELTVGDTGGRAVGPGPSRLADQVRGPAEGEAGQAHDGVLFPQGVGGLVLRQGVGIGREGRLRARAYKRTHYRHLNFLKNILNGLK